MRSVTTRYPVDRYLVESSNKFEMVNIIDDDLWKTEPALKPEDELILRKLHEMLQSTADDLKLLSGELSKFHEPGVHVKSEPTPLDEEFNEKVHIEEIVNAKFHGYKIIDKSSLKGPEYKPRYNVNNTKPVDNTQQPKNKQCNVQMNATPILKKPILRNLKRTPIKIVHIKDNQDSSKTEKLNNAKVNNEPTIAYNEFSFKYAEQKPDTPFKQLKVQVMPSVNIRSELKEQKVLQLDILPETAESVKSNIDTKNVGVVEVKHEPTVQLPTTSIMTESHRSIQLEKAAKSTIRKISKMSTCDSSGSTYNNSSDSHIKRKTQARIPARSPKSLARPDRKKGNDKKELNKRSYLNLDEWRQKLNMVYGSNIKNTKPKQKSRTKVLPKRSNTLNHNSSTKPNLNNAEYIPYSKLTIGGLRASDLEKEISNLPNKSNLPLSPILDRILSSRENSFTKSSPRKNAITGLNILTTSDENLLQEVIDIERTVSETLSKTHKNIKRKQQVTTENEKIKQTNDTEENKESESYADDFEDEKSDHSDQSANQRTYSKHSNQDNKTDDEENDLSSDGDDNNDNIIDHVNPSTSKANAHNLTYTKMSNLALKNHIDVFEFVHSIDKLESATQSNGSQRIQPKETQTTPRCDNNVQPIHNDLWSSTDPNSRVEKMLELEKDFIKKLIIEEYGILEKHITKPSTSKDIENKKNVTASQKNTQTSPAHMKNIMTSPTLTKTRTTSPFTTLTVDHQTSPLIFITNENDVNVEIEEEDLAISINLSSPRFSLRLPRNSQEVISNMGDSVTRREKGSSAEVKKVASDKKKTVNVRRKSSAEAYSKLPESRRGIIESGRNITNERKVVEVTKRNLSITTSSSSVEANSSDISSLGEVKLRRKLVRDLLLSDTESVSSASSKYSTDLLSGILPLRSEGETSLGFIKKSSKHNKSEGEASVGML